MVSNENWDTFNILPRKEKMKKKIEIFLPSSPNNYFLRSILLVIFVFACPPLVHLDLSIMNNYSLLNEKNILKQLFLITITSKIDRKVILIENFIIHRLMYFHIALRHHKSLFVSFIDFHLMYNHLGVALKGTIEEKWTIRN